MTTIDVPSLEAALLLLSRGIFSEKSAP